MKRLVVLDLDGTLIPYDSLRRYCLQLLRTPASWAVLHAMTRRMLRIDSPGEFLDRLDRAATTFLQHPERFHREFADRVKADFSHEVLAFVETQMRDSSEVVLCSASPAVYVQLLCADCGWKCLGSGRNSDGSMIRVHGERKLEMVQSAFPRSTYLYDLALADSTSDMPLLRQFERSYRVENNKGSTVRFTSVGTGSID